MLKNQRSAPRNLLKSHLFSFVLQTYSIKQPEIGKGKVFMSKKNYLNHSVSDSPLIPATQSVPEITLRVLILGVILTVILAAANAYLGLKVGQTISSSIPAAIISMSILRFFRNSNVLENTMVQTMASVGESLISGVAFILPALVILHVWMHFYYWQTVIAGLLGGTLGVLFTIPLRRALLLDKTLRYPEGVAISNVLKASATREKGDMKNLTVGGIVGALLSLFQTGFQVLTDNIYFWTKSSSTIFGIGFGLSPALIAAGYIVGINVSISILLGVVIGWVAGMPILSTLFGIPSADTVSDAAMIIWSSHIRYLGVGTMLVGGLWTLFTLVKPIIHSLSTSLASIRETKISGKKFVPRTERDIPINYVFWGMLMLLVPIFLLIMFSILPANTAMSHNFRMFVSGFSALYVLIGGFVVCSVSAYFAGLIGSTNTPGSGLMVSALLILGLILLAFFSINGGIQGKEVLGMVAAIGSTVIIGIATSISNDTMQDLKVGQILGATPWKQQLMLILGVVAAAFAVPPILDLLYNAYGIGGVFPRPGMDKTQMLSAPQAGLMASVAKGIFNHDLEWSTISVGIIIGVVCIVVDEFLKRSGNRLPVLAVGAGIYLPLDASIPVIIGGTLGYIIQLRLNKLYRSRPAQSDNKIAVHRHRGLLLACGMVAGASIMGVILAIPFAIKQSSDALKIMPDQYHFITGPISVVVTLLLCVWIYRVVMKKV